MVLVLLDWSCTEIGSWKRLTGREIDDDVRAERRKVGGIGSEECWDGDGLFTDGSIQEEECASGVVVVWVEDEGG